LVYIFSIAGIVLVYIYFFKPDPIFRVNINNLSKANPSVLKIEAPASISGVGKTFTVKIVLDTSGQYINAVQSHIEFDPRVLEVVNTQTEQSFCKFYPENNFSNDKGNIKLACGTPYPGFKGQNTLQTIEFLAKAISQTELRLTKDSMVLANDGKGTNLIKDYDTALIEVKAGL
jgi:hypothetical protein